MNPIMQKQFESWAKSWDSPFRGFIDLTIIDGCYQYPVTVVAYAAWRASLDVMVCMVELLNEDGQ